MALTRDKRNMFFLLASILSLIGLYNFLSFTHIMRVDSSSIRKVRTKILLPIERVKMYQTKEYASRKLISSDVEAKQNATTISRPRVYFDIEIDGIRAGRLEFVLFAEKVGDGNGDNRVAHPSF